MVDSIATHLLNLESLKFIISYGFDTQSLSHLKSLHLLKDLELISYLPLVSIDSHLIQILENCPKLRRLSLNGFSVTDKSMAKMGGLCPNLRVLRLIKSQDKDEDIISDESLDSWTSLQKLHTLDVEYLNRFSGNCFRWFLVSRPRLRYCRIEKCGHRLLTQNLCSYLNKYWTGMSLKLVLDVDLRSSLFSAAINFPTTLSFEARIGFDFIHDNPEAGQEPLVGDLSFSDQSSTSSGSGSGSSSSTAPRPTRSGRRSLSRIFKLLTSPFSRRNSHE
jgi:hypothetical protein